MGSSLSALGRGVVAQVQVSKLVVLTVLHPTKAGEVGLSQVVRGAIVCAVFTLVIDPACDKHGR